MCLWVSYKQKIWRKKKLFFCILKVTEERSRIHYSEVRIRAKMSRIPNTACKLVRYWLRQPQPAPVSFVSTGTQTDITQSDGPIQLRRLSCSPQLPEPNHPSELSPQSEPQPPAALVGCGELAQPPTTVVGTLPTNSNIDALEPLATSPSRPLLTNPKIPLKLRQGRAASTPHKMSINE